MRKILLILMTLLTFGVSGAWSTPTTIALGSSSHIKANGIFYDSNDAVVAGSAWCAKVVVGSVTLSGAVSNYSGYFDAQRNSTLTISVPAGKTISSYSFGLRLTGNTTACTATGNAAVTLSNSTFKTVAKSGVNAQSTNITFSEITKDASNECLIEISDLVINIEGYEGTSYVVSTNFPREIKVDNGTFYKGNPKVTPNASLQYPNRWVSTDLYPQLKLVTSQIISNGESYTGGGDIVVDSDGFRFGGSNTYTLSSTQNRYYIAGYLISCYTAEGKTFTITPNGQTSRTISTDSSNPTYIYVDGLNALSTTISASAGSQPYIYITSFRVAYNDLVDIANDALDELANVSAYSTAAPAAKTTIASLYTQAEIESAINSAVNINVAFGNCNTSNPVKYLATTGSNITCSAFSTDAAWTLTGYNAEAGTFKLYNAAHETYVAPLPSAYNTAATATTNSNSAGSWVVTATTASASSGAGNVFMCRPDYASYNALHYQTANSIAVRWNANNSTVASQWTVNNVYKLTYNHYKVADAEDPSTEGASLFASSTEYYISGTNIEYMAPLAGLSPVDALNDQPDDGAISSDVVVNYYYEQDATLPFTTSSISGGELDNPTWYYMIVNSMPAYVSGNKMIVDNTGSGLHYERWCFVGDAINGVQIFSEAKGVVYPLNIDEMTDNDHVQLTSTSTNTRWFVSGSDLSSLKFYQKSGDNTFYLLQLGGLEWGSGWGWKVGLFARGDDFSLYEATDNANNAGTIAACNEAVATIMANDAFTNAGKIGYPSAANPGPYTSLFSKLSAVAVDSYKTHARYAQLIGEWDSYQNTTNLTTPPAGFYKFYHKTTSSGNKKYVYADETTAKSSTSNGTESQKIWYFDGTNNHLVNYDKGYQFSSMATLNETGVGMTISGHTTHTVFPMPYNIKPSNASSWYVTNTDEDYDLNRASVTEGSNFYVEQVTSLPITFRGEYASFYSPVDLEIPNNSNLKVYTGGEVNNGWMTLDEITETIPANTGVILHLDGWTTETSIDFDILSTSAVGGTGALTGTVTAMSVDADSKMVLGYEDYQWGIYNYSGTTLGGFKAYMNKLSSSVKGFAFNFADADAIVKVLNGEQQNGECYDLSGRLVSKPVKGMYIINGKKVIVK